MVAYDKIIFSTGELSVPQIRLVSKLLFMGKLSMETVETRIGPGAVGNGPC